MLDYGTANADPTKQGHLMHNLLLFGRVLHGLGLPASVPAMIDVTQALGHIQIGRRLDFKHTMRSLLVRRKDDLARFDEAFDTFWVRPAGEGYDLPLSELYDERPKQKPRVQAPALQEQVAEVDAQELPENVEQVLELTRTYSDAEMLRAKDFGEMGADELAAVRNMLRALHWNVGLRRTRRLQTGASALLDARRTLRINLRHGGEILHWAHRTPRYKPRPLVVIADISGSMERYTKLLLDFLYTLANGMDQRVESFVFATRMTRITRQLNHKSIETAIADVGARVLDWSGGTRIGECIKRFNFDWGRRVLHGGAAVLIISDGWDRGDPAMLGREMARLRRTCHRVIWLNPLLGMADYEPLTRGLQAAMPHIDDFLPVHNLASLEALAEHLRTLNP